MTRRILITGSRTWDRPSVIHYALDEAAEPGDILVSGACPTGADAIAEAYWEGKGPIERHPADWATHGKRAGFIRNAEMVYAGADVCLAFIRDESKGATMTADYAERYDIPTRRFFYQP